MTPIVRSSKFLTGRFEPALLDRVKTKARADGIPVSDMLGKSLEVYTQDVAPEGVMIRPTPYYRGELGQTSAAVLERFMQLALDGAWTLTDREE